MSEYSYSDSDTEDLDIVGEVLKKRYVLLAPIGSGKVATIMLAFDVNTNNFYAIKVMNIGDYDSGKSEADLYKVVSSNSCKYFNRVIDSFIWDPENNKFTNGVPSEDEEEERHVCLVFDLCGGSLYDIMKGKYSNGLSLPLVKKAIQQLLLAMDHLNTECNILHTDIKPENMLIKGVSNDIKDIMDEFISLYNKGGGKKKKKRNPLAEAKNIVSRLSCNKSESSESSASDRSIIDNKYMQADNFNILLSDFGESYKMDEETDSRIQTIYYRSPEIILDGPFNTTCDVWSVGCTLFELLTGEILFNPDDQRSVNKERQLLYLIQSRLGMIPTNLVNKTKKRKFFFQNNGLLKGRYNINYEPLSCVVKKRLIDRKDIDETELEKIIDFMYSTFEYDVNKRPTPKQCLQHRLFL